MTDAALRELGAQLRAAGLNARALDAWATARLAALPGWLVRRTPSAATPVDALLGLMIAGDEVERDRLRAPVDAMIAQGLVEEIGGRVRARVAVLPLGAALVVCDRMDAPVARERVSWPDDSSYHLAGALPAGRRARWLDLACGSAFAPLARPGLAAEIGAVDVNPRAVEMARMGAALSGVAHVACEVGDIGAEVVAADLVSCNAPIPGEDEVSGELWRRAEPGFFARLWPALRAAARPGGMIVVHAAREAMAEVEGERVVVRYTPDGARGFAILWWRPDGPSRFVEVARRLTADRPHVEPADRDAALC